MLPASGWSCAYACRHPVAAPARAARNRARLRVRPPGVQQVALQALPALLGAVRYRYPLVMLRGYWKRTKAGFHWNGNRLGITIPVPSARGLLGCLLYKHPGGALHLTPWHGAPAIASFWRCCRGLVVAPRGCTSSGTTCQYLPDHRLCWCLCPAVQLPLTPGADPHWPGKGLAAVGSTLSTQTPLMPSCGSTLPIIAVGASFSAECCSTPPKELTATWIAGSHQI